LHWVLLLEFSVVAALSAAFLVVGYRLCRQYPRARYPLIILGSVCLLYRVLTATFPERFYILTPHRLLTGFFTPAGFLLLAAAMARPLRHSLQRILVAVFSVVLAYYVFGDAAYLAVAGHRLAELDGRWQGPTMRQSTTFTCGPAAGAALLRAWGINVREGDLAFAARTSYRGTEMLRLAEALRHFGRTKPLDVRVLSADFEQLILMNRPAVLLVRKERQLHTITLLRADRGSLLIADPASGTVAMHLSDFRDHYTWDGPAIVAWRRSDFERRSDEPPDPALHE
jgi:predicted double-glycine peptidase